MALYNNLMNMYMAARIGSAEIMTARDNGWIDDAECDRIITTRIAYPLEKAKAFKKKELSYFCNKAISAGVDVQLSDGEVHHFSLTDHDQTNLNAKMSNLLAGVQKLEYHSDGDPCMYYSAEDMMQICLAAQQKVTYETTYYNCMVQRVKACQTGSQILNINYGDEVPEEFWSGPWRGIQEALEEAEKEKGKTATEVITGGVNVSEQALTQYEPMETGPAEEPTKKTTRKKKE